MALVLSLQAVSAASNPLPARNKIKRLEFHSGVLAESQNQGSNLSPQEKT